MSERQIDNMWRKLEFQVDDTRRDVTATLWVNGKIIRRTRRSHGAGKMTGMIPQLIRQQMKLNEEQFKRAVECPLKAPEYRDILRAKGLLTG